MCFSAQASFAAAAFLGAVGIATIRVGASRGLLLIGMIPLLFSIQQLSEGLLWLNLTQTVMQYTFLFFAFFVWPIWAPLSLAVAEKEKGRRYMIYFFLACGVILSLLNAYFAFQTPATVQIVNHSLQYRGSIPRQEYIYPLIVILPCFISSLLHAWLFGVLLAITYAIAYYFYTETFVSVWCFFAAIISICLYKVLKDN